MPSHTATIRRWFGLPDAPPPQAVPAGFQLPIVRAGQIILITGPSGAGKSCLLQRFLQAAPAEPIWIDAVDLPDQPVVDCFGSMELTDTLRLLSRCGLAEAWTYLRRPAELSNGQRWRLRLALALAQVSHAPAEAGSALRLLVSDEFAAVLDRVSAAVIARMLRRLIHPSRPVAALCTTSHDDLRRALDPDLIITCDFGAIDLATRP